MIKYVASLLLLPAALLFAQGNQATRMEQQLTGGNIKRWIFHDHEYTLGDDCETSILTFKLNDHSFFEKPCTDSEGTANRNGKWSIKATGTAEHQITMGKETYFLDFYDSTVDKTKVRTMRLMKKAARQEQPTVSAIYYEEI